MIGTPVLEKPSIARAPQPAAITDMPPPPPGFVLEPDVPSGTAGPSTGATGDLPPPPPGFVLEASPAAQPHKLGGAALNASVGLASAVPTLLGGPVDLARTAINASTQPNEIAANLPIVGPFIRATQIASQAMGVPAIPDDSLLGRQWFLNQLTAAGVPNVDTVEATNTWDKIARSAGEGVGFTVAPEAAVASLTRLGVAAPKAIEILQTAFGKAESLGAMGANAVSGGAAGAGAAAAAEAAPENLKPIAATVGGLVGGGVGLAASATPRAVGAGVRRIGDVVAPLTAAGRERMAGTQLRDAATSPGQVVDDIANAEELVPGSQPTTFQQTGDMGLGELERVARNRNPAMFNQRAADQNAARLGAMDKLQPTGSPDRVVGAVRSHLAAIDDQAKVALDAAQGTARSRTAALGEGATPEVAGTNMRTTLEAARTTAKADERALWEAVDPDGTLALPASATKQQATTITKGMAASAKPMEGEEAAVFDVARKYGDGAVSFSEVTALQSRIKAAMREERFKNGETPAYRRLTMLNGAIQRDLETAVSGKVKQEAADVAAGRLSEADTVAGRLQSGAVPSAGTSVYTPAGRKVDVAYRVVDADQPITSNLSDMRVNPQYPAELQPRNRTRAASELQVAKMAGELQPERLGPSSSAAEGAPILGPDGMVESGNARMLAIRRAYQQNGKSAQQYRDYVQSLGYSTKGIAKPVLVRVRSGDMPPAERVRFAQEANASPTLAMSASERAASDATRLDRDVLSLYRGGDVASAENRDFVRSFLGKVADPGEEGAFVTGDGSLSLDGAQRVRGALLRSAYDDVPLVEALADAGDDNIRVFDKALQEVAGDVARLKQGIAAGAVSPKVDIAPPMIEAAKFVQDARRRGVGLATAIAQRDAFDTVSDDALVLLRASYGSNLAGRMARGDFESMVRDVISEAELQTTDARLFGESSSISDILRAHDGTNTRTARSIAPDAQAPGQGTGGPRDPERGPGASSARTGSSEAGRNASVLEQQPGPGANFDEAALRRLNAARAATKDRVETFDNKVLAPIRRRPGTTAPYDVPAAAVPGKIFFPGPKSFEAVQTYRTAVGDGPALSELEAYAVDRLRKVALREDGTLDPARVTAFRRGHADALRAFPELDKGFADAATASETMAAVATARKTALDEAQEGTVGRLIGVDDPSDVVRLVGGIFSRSDSVVQMRQVRRAIGTDRDAAEGLRKAVVDHVLDKFVSNTEAATSGLGTIKSDGLQTFFARNKAALAEAGFSEPEINMMDRVAQDLQQANRSVSAVKLAGGSDTAQNLLADAAKHATKSLLTKLVVTAAASGPVGWIAGPVVGTIVTAAGLSTVLVGALRQAGINKVDDLVRDALLHPERARLLLMKVGPEKERSISMSLAGQYRRAVVAGMAAGVTGDEATK